MKKAKFIKLNHQVINVGTKMFVDFFVTLSDGQW